MHQKEKKRKKNTPKFREKRICSKPKCARKCSLHISTSWQSSTLIVNLDVRGSWFNMNMLKTARIRETILTGKNMPCLKVVTFLYFEANIFKDKTFLWLADYQFHSLLSLSLKPKNIDSINNILNIFMVQGVYLFPRSRGYL